MMRKLLSILLFIPLAAIASDHCDSMMPLGKPIAQEQRLTYICRKMYVLEHSPIRKSAVWVAERVARDNFSGREKRADQFKPDPALKATERAYSSDYSNSGYDRGHLAPAGNMDSSTLAVAESFYLSNIVPQNPLNNRGVWRLIEEEVRQLSIQHGEVFVITGPVYAKHPDTIGKGKVNVPSHLYKIVTTKYGQILLAVMVPNRPISRAVVRSSTILISEIEKETGIRFFPKLQ